MRLAYTMGTLEAGTVLLGWVGDAATVAPALAAMGYAGVELQVRGPDAYDARAFGSLLGR